MVSEINQGPFYVKICQPADPVEHFGIRWGQVYRLKVKWGQIPTVPKPSVKPNSGHKCQSILY